MQKLALKIKSETYRCEITFDALLAIESKIKIRELAEAMRKSHNNYAAFPFLHLIYAMKCILDENGFRQFSLDSLREMFKTGELTQEPLVELGLYVLKEVYGVGPEKKPQPETENTATEPTESTLPNSTE